MLTDEEAEELLPVRLMARVCNPSGWCAPSLPYALEAVDREDIGHVR